MAQQTYEKREVSLSRWGPPRLYQWLYESWNTLRPESRAAIKQLCSKNEAKAELLKNLVPYFEYERLIPCLAMQDFQLFVERVLEESAIPASYQDLNFTLPEFRQILTKVFNRTIFWPLQGFTGLLKEAIEAGAKAVEQLPRVASVVNVLDRCRAVEAVHDGVDRALLCTERFVELLLEFLTEICFFAETIGALQAERWREIAGASQRNTRKLPDWGMKEEAVHNAADEIVNKSNPPEGIEDIWDKIKNLARACYGPKQKVDGREVRKPEDAGLVMRSIIVLRDKRNILRHASPSLQAEQSVPGKYREAADEFLYQLRQLESNFLGLKFHPTIVRVLSATERCFGEIELTLALEDGRLVSARYINREILAQMGVNEAELRFIMWREENNRLLFPEFFLFPAPLSGQRLLSHPLLLKRAALPRAIEPIMVKVPGMIVPAPAFSEEAIL